MHGPRNGIPASSAIILRLDPVTYQEIADRAAADERSMSSWLRRLVEEQLQVERAA